MCDSFLYSSYRFHSTSDQVQEPLFVFQGTLLLLDHPLGSAGYRPEKSDSLVNDKGAKESMEVNSLTFENGSGLINRMLR